MRPSGCTLGDSSGELERLRGLRKSTREAGSGTSSKESSPFQPSSYFFTNIEGPDKILKKEVEMDWKREREREVERNEDREMARGMDGHREIGSARTESESLMERESGPIGGSMSENDLSIEASKYRIELCLYYSLSKVCTNLSFILLVIMMFSCLSKINSR